MEVGSTPSTDGEGAQPPDKHDVWNELTPESRERLADILRDQVPETFKLNRIIEQKTGYTSPVCRTMLSDVLAHLGTLASRGDELNAEQQASQLAKIEEHLRRAIIEHPEEVVRNRLGEVEELWGKYHREAFPLRERGQLHGAPRHQELEELRLRIDTLMESARSQKPNETTWDEALDAAAEMTEAANVASELADRLQQCLGEAERVKREAERDATTAAQHKTTNKNARRALVAAIILAVLGTAGGVVGGYLLGDRDDDSEATTAPAADQPASGKKANKP